MDNKDFDGDMLSGQLLPDENWTNAFGRLDAHLALMDTNEPFTVSNSINIPAPPISTANSWLMDGLNIAGLSVEK